jgi:hypothetical protein
MRPADSSPFSPARLAASLRDANRQERGQGELKNDISRFGFLPRPDEPCFPSFGPI